MKKINIISLLLVFVMILSACGKAGSYQEPSAKETLENSFLVDKNGQVIEEKETGNRKVVQVYFDPRCPSCAVAEEIIADKLEGIAGDSAVFRYNPVAFIGDDGVNTSYSHRIASMILSVKELEKDKTYEFLKSVMNIKFMENITKELEKEISENTEKYIKDKKYTEAFYKMQDEKIFAHVKEVYTGNDFNKMKDNAEKKISLVKQLTSIFFENDKLKKMSKDGKLYTPMIIVEGNNKVLDSTLETLVEDLKKAIQAKK